MRCRHTPNADIVVNFNYIRYIASSYYFYGTVIAMNSTSTSDNVTSIIPSSLLVFKAFAFGILIILNLCLNSLTLVVLRRMRELKPATRVFLTSMTVADLVSLVYHIPIFISTIVNQWPFGDTPCTVFSLAGLVVNILYYINLPMVTIERYIAVAWPFRYPSLVTVKRSRMVVVGAWSFALLGATGTYFLGPYQQYVETLHACIPSPGFRTAQTDKTLSIPFDVIGMLVISLTPVALSLVLFFRLYIITRAHIVRIAAQNRNAAWNNNNTLAMERKTLITFFIMTICVTFCMIPNIVLSVFIYSNEHGESYINYWFTCFAQLMYLSNTIVNVIVYYWRTVAFRETVKRLFHNR